MKKESFFRLTFFLEALIFRDEVATSSLPVTLQSPNDILVVTCILLPTIKKKILDYKEIID